MREEITHNMREKITHTTKVFPLSQDAGVVSRANELGITHLDTSDVYGPHKNEVSASMPLACQAAHETMTAENHAALGWLGGRCSSGRPSRAHATTT